MTIKLQKKLVYRYADFSVPERTLEEHLRESLSIQPQLVFPIDNQQVSLFYYENLDQEGCCIRLISYKKGDKQKVVGYGEKSLDGHPAPPGKDYLQNDTICYLKKNHLLVCFAKGRMSPSIFFEFLFSSTKKDDLIKKYELIDVASKDTIQLIHTDKVKDIYLNADLSEANTGLLLGKTNNTLAKIFGELFPQDLNLTPKEQRRIKGCIKISLDGRAKKVALPELLENAAVSLLEEECEGLSLLLKSGKRITGDSVKIVKTYSISEDDGTVEYGSCKDAMLQFYGYLKNNNLLQVTDNT